MTWETCRIGSCHRHQKCMYVPCRNAIAAGTQSAETNEDLAQSEGCQSGANGNRTNPVHIDPLGTVEFVPSEYLIERLQLAALQAKDCSVSSLCLEAADWVNDHHEDVRLVATTRRLYEALVLLVDVTGNAKKQGYGDPVFDAHFRGAQALSIARAIAAGTQSAETNEDLAQSEGCQSGANGNRTNRGT